MIESEKGFFIGDVCYVLDDEIYHGFWGNENNYEDGVFEVPGYGRSFAVASTAYGDGEYTDEEGNRYPVDAGVIGLVPLELVGKEDGMKLGTVVKGRGIAVFESCDGSFDITLPRGKTVHIHTGDEESNEEEY